MDEVGGDTGRQRGGKRKEGRGRKGGGKTKSEQEVRQRRKGGGKEGKER